MEIVLALKTFCAVGLVGIVSIAPLIGFSVLLRLFDFEKDPQFMNQALNE